MSFNRPTSLIHLIPPTHTHTCSTANPHSVEPPAPLSAPPRVHSPPPPRSLLPNDSISCLLGAPAFTWRCWTAALQTSPPSPRWTSGWTPSRWASTRSTSPTRASAASAWCPRWPWSESALPFVFFGCETWDGVLSSRFVHENILTLSHRL